MAPGPFFKHYRDHRSRFGICGEVVEDVQELLRRSAVSRCQCDLAAEALPFAPSRLSSQRWRRDLRASGGRVVVRGERRWQVFQRKNSGRDALAAEWPFLRSVELAGADDRRSTKAGGRPYIEALPQRGWQGASVEDECVHQQGRDVGVTQVCDIPGSANNSRKVQEKWQVSMSSFGVVHEL